MTKVASDKCSVKKKYQYINIMWQLLTRKHQWWNLFLILSNAKFFRALILKNICKRLLLKMFIKIIHKENYTLFFIRTSKCCLRLAVLNFSFVFEAEIILICSYFPTEPYNVLQEECQTEYNKSTLFHFFHSF